MSPHYFFLFHVIVTTKSEIEDDTAPPGRWSQKKETIICDMQCNFCEIRSIIFSDTSNTSCCRHSYLYILRCFMTVLGVRIARIF